MRIVKQKLLEMMPDLSIFLDVDDLKKGAGGEYVDRSSCILVFCTERYLKSRACARELFKAVLAHKPIIMVLEPLAKRGGLTREQITHVLMQEDFAPTTTPARVSTHGPLQEDVTAAHVDWSAKWSLDGEVTSWGHACRPSGAELVDALFEHPPIEWNRFADLQDVTMRLIAERLLPDAKYTRTFVKGEIGQTQIKLPPPLEGREFHLYCSPYNMGALKLGEELRELIQASTPAKDAALLMTTELDKLRSCDYMLLYLTSATWRSGSNSTQYASEVLAALQAGVALLLVHEFPSTIDENNERQACEFDMFWKDGWTPKHLLLGEFNIYRQIAIAVKVGAWRRPGLIQIALKLASGGLPRHPAKGKPELQLSTHHNSSLRRSRWLSKSGVVSVKICSASRLRCGGDSTCLADPYVVVRLGNMEHSSQPREGTLDPTWEDETFEVEVPQLADLSTMKLELHVRNHDAFRLDDDLGSVIVPLARMIDSDMLQFTEELSKQGTLTFSVAWRACKIKAQKDQPSRFASVRNMASVKKFASVKNLESMKHLWSSTVDKGEGASAAISGGGDGGGGGGSDGTSAGGSTGVGGKSGGGGRTRVTHAVTFQSPAPSRARQLLDELNPPTDLPSNSVPPAQALPSSQATTQVALTQQEGATMSPAMDLASSPAAVISPVSDLPSERHVPPPQAAIEAGPEQAPFPSDRLTRAIGELTDRVSRWPLLRTTFLDSGGAKANDVAPENDTSLQSPVAPAQHSDASAMDPGESSTVPSVESGDQSHNDLTA